MDDTAPKLDPRSHDDVIAQTEALVTAYTTGESNGPWRPRTDGTLDFGGALVRLFAGMVDHLVAQLNQVPDKHRRAFTGLLGARRIPPRPARAPVSFTLAAGDDVGTVPAGAQIAATGPEGPAVFETELALPLTRARLAAVFVRDVPGTGYADATAIATGNAPGPFAALGGGGPIEHKLHVAVEDLLAVPGAGTLTVVLDGQGNALPSTKITWIGLPEVTVTGNKWTLAVPASAIVASAVNGATARWLTADVPAGTPAVKVTAAVAFSMTAVPLDAAYANGQALDFTRDVLPFGERPRFNDTCYLASDAAFAVTGTAVTLTFGLTLPPGGVNASADLKLQWETWNGQTATVIGTTTSTGVVTGGITDGTKAFTQAGAVAFTLTSGLPRSTIGSVTSRWVRVRIIAGNYGSDLSVTTDGGTPPAIVITPASFRPPSVSSVALGWSGAIPAQPPTAIVRRTALTYEALPPADPAPIYLAAPELAYQATPDATSSLHLGFDRAFEPALTTLYLQVFPPASPDPAALGSEPAPRKPPLLAWEYWKDPQAKWTALTVEDGTQSLSRSGLVRFLPPADPQPLAQFGRTLFWLRARVLNSGFTPMPQLGRVLGNTVWAAHAHTSRLEVLGASNGARDQRFTVAQAPVLDGQRIEVGEPEPPRASDLAALQAAEGSDVLTPDPVAGFTWVRWHEVADFLASGPRDRHYTFDAATGTVTFGNGTAGMIPPIGVQNVRAAEYRAGGGTAGNVAVGAIAQLKTTVSVVERTTNHEAAIGGAPIEPEAAMLDRAARTLRHGGRAVTAQDFADLALESSLAVARAVTLTPAFSPISQGSGPSTAPSDLRRDGEVIVVIVPAAVQPGMAPSVDLCAEVEDYLRARCAPDAQVTVTGPSWVAADIEIHVAAASIERSAGVLAAVRAAIAQLLDPLTGGDGGGWDFGRRPRASDIVASLACIADIDHVSEISVTCGVPFDNNNPQQEGPDTLSVFNRLLVYARSITVTASQVVP